MDGIDHLDTAEAARDPAFAGRPSRTRAAARDCAHELADLLRETRLARGFSQLELALRLGVSQRHVAYVERGRARPSRALLLAWMQMAAAPRSLQNVALARAGFVSSGATHAAAESDLAAILAGLEPVPALALDAGRVLLDWNVPARALWRRLAPTVTPGAELCAAWVAPGGVLDRLGDRTVVARALLAQLRLEAWLHPRLAAAADAVEAYLSRVDAACTAHAARRRCSEGPPGDSVDAASRLRIALELDGVQLAFDVVQCLVALPHDVSVDMPRLESWLPADARTRAYVAASCVYAAHAPAG